MKQFKFQFSCYETNLFSFLSVIMFYISFVPAFKDAFITEEYVSAKCLIKAYVTNSVLKFFLMDCNLCGTLSFKNINDMSLKVSFVFIMFYTGEENHKEIQLCGIWYEYKKYISY